MKELTKIPVRVQNGNKEFELYEAESGYCMTSEFLGNLLGYKNPGDQMGKLFRRNKAILEVHRFSVKVTENLWGGRPSYFYDKGGIVKAFMLAGTSQAKEIGARLIDYIEHLEARRMAHIEAYWFDIRPFWPEIRERVLKGEPFRVIAEAMGRSAASVRNAVRRMIQVGIMQPLRAAQSLTGRARKTVLRYGRKYIKDDRQLGLFDEPRTD